jgi:putative membrane protein insertion efficiency factor
MIVLLIDIYQLAFSNVLRNFFGLHCRFSPTCSEYSREAFKHEGLVAGFVKSTKRLLRCHPWGSFGEDPVKKVSRGA